MPIIQSCYAAVDSLHPERRSYAHPIDLGLLVRIDGSLRRSMDDFVRLYSGIDGEATSLATVGRMLSTAGGKRIRAQLFYWGWRAAGRSDCDDIIDLAVALEVLHLFALVHDDVMDCSSSRRGVRSAHRQFVDMHPERGRPDRAEHFGMSAAILVGDALVMWADAVIDSSPLIEARLSEFRRAYNTMRLELVGGQYLDVIGEHDVAAAPLPDILKVARLKSGNYSIAEPLRLGAIAGGADDPTLAFFEQLGGPLGEAFQLHDDLIGVFGSPEATGKPAGDDLRHGKRTALIAIALSAAGPTEADTLMNLLRRGDLDDRDVDQAKAIITDCGALALVEHMIEDRVHGALHRLDNSGIDAPVKHGLTELLAIC